MDPAGKPAKVVKYASDVTGTKLQTADYAGQIAAISKSQAVIEFDLRGIILTANENFLRVMGYSAPEVVGQHHSIFVDPDDAADPSYAAFWGDAEPGRVHRAGVPPPGQGRPGRMDPSFLQPDL